MMTSRTRGVPRHLVAAILIIALRPFGSAMAGVGDIDTGYGNEGALQLSPVEGGWSWVVLSEGRVLSAHVANGSLHLLRHDRNGRPDTSFGTAGEQAVPMPATGGGVRGLTVAGDGSFFVALFRESPQSTASVGRITSSGVLDTRFGQDGWLSFPASAVVQGGTVVIDGMAGLDDGGVAINLRYWQAYCGRQEALLLLRPDGLTRDGLVPAAPPTIQSAGGGFQFCYDFESVELQQLSSGMLRVANSWDLRLVEVDGRNIVPDFGNLPGDAFYNYSNNFPMKLVPDAAREFDYVLREAPNLSRVELVRLRPDGTVDHDFGEGGRAVVDFLPALPPLAPNNPGFFGSPAFFADGFVNAGGSSGQFIYVTVNAQEAQSPGDSVLVARLHRDGTLDATFGRSGLLRFPGLQSAGGAAGEPGNGSALLPLRLSSGIAAIRLQEGNTPSPGLISLAGSGAGLGEGEVATAYVSRSLGSLGPASVRFRLIPGSALAGTDYTNVTGTLVWADGETGTRKIEIPLVMDQQVENSEGFSLVLEGATGAVILPDQTWRVSIYDRSPQYGQPASSPSFNSVPEDTVSGGGSLETGSLAVLFLALLRRLRRSPAYSRSRNR